MTHGVKKKWQSFLRFIEVLDTGSSYPLEQIHELQLEVARLKSDRPVRVTCAEAQRRT